MKSTMKGVLAALLMTTGMAAPTMAADGVTDTEILLGSSQDMSGPFAAFGAPAIQAANQYFESVNAAGGVHGRTIRLIAEDHGYQMPKAMANLNKLVNADGIFAMFLQLGTPMNEASFPLLESKGIPNVSPLSAARQMTDPPSSIKFAGFSSYYDQMRAGINYLAANEGTKVVCSMYLPTDFGLEIQLGTKEEAEALGLKYASETTHKPDELDFVGSLTKLKSEGCDTIAIALGLRQVITAVATAKKMGWTDAKFIGSSAAFHTAVAKVPGGVTEGFYAAAGWADIEARVGNPTVGAWVAEYKGAFGEFPGTGALLGRSAAEGIVMALEAAGPDLTREGFIKAMESLSYRDEIAGADVDYSADDHQGGDLIVISKIDGGSWVELARQ